MRLAWFGLLLGCARARPETVAPTEPVAPVEGNETLAVERGRSTLVYGREGGGEPHRSVVEFMLVWVRAVPGDPSTPWRIAVDAYW